MKIATVLLKHKTLNKYIRVNAVDYGERLGEIDYSEYELYSEENAGNPDDVAKTANSTIGGNGTNQSEQPIENVTDSKPTATENTDSTPEPSDEVVPTEQKPTEQKPATSINTKNKNKNKNKN